MSNTLIFVPVSQTQAAALLADGFLPERQAFTVTPQLVEMLEYGPDQQEDAEYAAMVIASVAGLSTFGHRLVLVAEVPQESLGLAADPENGEMLVGRLDRQQVVAFFADDPAVDVSAAAQEAAGLGIDDAWNQQAVVELLATSDLLWHGAEELASVASKLNT